MIAATATDTIQTTLEIINSFSKRSIIKDMAVERNRTDYSIILPDFKITAGIAGGNLTTPLIITESGLLSGFLINTAARLQNRANELSPHESKLMVSQTVYTNFLKENKVVKSDLYANKLLYFFNNGPVSFKGLKISSYEIIFKKPERYREKYAGNMEALYDSLKQKLWNHKVFQDLVTVIIQACNYMPHFSSESLDLSNTSLIQSCEKALYLYDKEEDYISAVSLLGRMKEQIEHIEQFDRLILDYVSEIHGKYRELIDAFERKLEKEIEKKIDIIFNPQYKRAFYNSKKSIETHKKLIDYARKSDALKKKKIIWYSLIEEKKDELDLEIYSGKK